GSEEDGAVSIPRPSHEVAASEVETAAQHRGPRIGAERELGRSAGKPRRRKLALRERHLSGEMRRAHAAPRKRGGSHLIPADPRRLSIEIGYFFHFAVE